VKQDEKEAAHWFRKAAEKGQQEAKDALQRLKK
jgi:TPR repeat protein